MNVTRMTEQAQRVVDHISSMNRRGVMGVSRVELNQLFKIGSDFRRTSVLSDVILNLLQYGWLKNYMEADSNTVLYWCSEKVLPNFVSAYEPRVLQPRPIAHPDLYGVAIGTATVAGWKKAVEENASKVEPKPVAQPEPQKKSTSMPASAIPPSTPPEAERNWSEIQSIDDETVRQLNAVFKDSPSDPKKDSAWFQMGSSKPSDTTELASFSAPAVAKEEPQVAHTPQEQDSVTDPEVKVETETSVEQESETAQPEPVAAEKKDEVEETSLEQQEEKPTLSSLLSGIRKKPSEDTLVIQALASVLQRPRHNSKSSRLHYAVLKLVSLGRPSTIADVALALEKLKIRDSTAADVLSQLSAAGFIEVHSNDTIEVTRKGISHLTVYETVRLDVDLAAVTSFGRLLHGPQFTIQVGYPDSSEISQLVTAFSSLPAERRAEVLKAIKG